MKNTDIKKLKSFGITMGIACVVIGLVLFFQHKNAIAYAIISAGFFLAAMVIPGLLKPLYFFWMKLAFLLAWINTRLILFLIFYLIFTPIGLILKLLRKDLLDKKINKAEKSYWRKKEKNEFGLASYEKQF